MRYFLCLTAMAMLPVASWPQADPEKALVKGPRELHVVSIYEGLTETAGQIHGPKAFVSVSRPGKSVTLVLTSYSPVTWEVSPTTGTTIEKVILGGHGARAVKGLAPKVPVTRQADLPYAYRLDSGNFRKLVRDVAKTTDQGIASFHGAYRAEAVPFTIDAVQDEPRLSADYPKPLPAAELPKLEFQAHHYTPGMHRHDVESSFGTFTLAGPKADTLKPLPRDVKRVAYDPVDKKHYGIAGHEVVELDADWKGVTKMDMGLDVPPLSWPCEITFDTKRQRLLLGSSAGGGYIYAFSPKTKTWTTVCKRPSALDAFAYSEKDDSIYGVLLEHSDHGSVPVLCQLNSMGAVIQRIQLGDPMFPGCLGGGPGVCTTQVVPVDDRIIIMGAPGSLRSGSDGWYIYFYDLKTGKLALASKKLQ